MEVYSLQFAMNVYFLMNVVYCIKSYWNFIEKKTFDNVWRRALWFILLHNNIRCETYDILYEDDSVLLAESVTIYFCATFCLECYEYHFAPKNNDFDNLLFIFKTVSWKFPFIFSKVFILNLWPHDYFIGLPLFNFINKYCHQNKLKNDLFKNVFFYNIYQLKCLASQNRVCKYYITLFRIYRCALKELYI